MPSYESPRKAQGISMHTFKSNNGFLKTSLKLNNIFGSVGIFSVSKYNYVAFYF